MISFDIRYQSSNKTGTQLALTSDIKLPIQNSISNITYQDLLNHEEQHSLFYRSPDHLPYRTQ